MISRITFCLTCRTPITRWYPFLILHFVRALQPDSSRFDALCLPGTTTRPPPCNVQVRIGEIEMSTVWSSCWTPRCICTIMSARRTLTARAIRASNGPHALGVMPERCIRTAAHQHTCRHDTAYGRCFCFF